MAHEFNPQNEINSFSSYSADLTLRNPTWTPDQIHRKALIDFNTVMFPTQVRTHFAEQRGEQVMAEEAVYKVVNGKLTNEFWGDFDSMIANAKTEEERASLTLWQETMVKAAPGTRVVSVDLHQSDHNGKHEIRYADIAVKLDDGTVKMEKRVDIVHADEAVDISTSWVFLKNAARSGSDRTLITNGMKNVGIIVIEPGTEKATNKKFDSQPKVRLDKRNLVDRTIPQLDVGNEKTRDQSGSDRLHIQPRGIVHEIGVDIHNVGTRVIRDISTTARASVTYIAEAARKKHTGVKKQEELPVQVFSVQKKDRLSLSEIHKKPVDFMDLIGQKSRQVEQAKKSISFVKETNVALGAIPLLLRTLASELPKPLRAVEKSIARHARKEMKRVEKKERRIRKKNEHKNLKKSEAVEYKRKKRRSREILRKPIKSKERQKHSKKKRIKTVERGERHRMIKKRRSVLHEKHVVLPEIRHAETRIVLKPKEKKRVRKILVRVIGEIREMREAPVKNRKDRLIALEKIRHIDKKIAVPVFRVTFGIILFLLLRQIDAKPRKISRLSLEMEKRELPKKEATQWILLSIIWYLAMIREGAMGSKQKRPQTKMPKHGVIFMANS
ncbi:hypothetical protein A2971_01650 [Candidatus Gottesmanbacteria bacterium RIFCSPLOWO2_01_FULL_46_21]|uniref:Uncharacterized protein n=1 Tax=Candidatus Gottesmanbacteria bacterium RIFCSPLOWO2_01_FULL_46_21 TaxID=1798393 RepID=A0A1F6AV75_9BACT|nr:MAG: hypothetical protein A2971_01650 [Candidatus Gottesmanbacteria bacterium RIFCSPLOWO2_01_FULL_46_21]